MKTNPQSQTPEISIIIRSKNEERFIGQTLSAIFQQDIDIPFEVILIDSGSTDRTLEVVREYPVSVYEIDTRQFSYGRALNYGAGLARGQYLINLSAHCIPIDSCWMARLVNCLRSDSQVAATYGGQLPIKGVNPFEERSLVAVFTPNNEGKIDAPFSNANCAIRKETWKIYPFDENASFAEDFIWSQMLPGEHEIKYVPEAAVYHTHPLRLRYWSRRSYDNGVVVRYLEHVYGLQYRWADKDNRISSHRTYVKEFINIIGRRAARYFKIVIFLLENGYLKFIPVLPIYSLVEQYYYRKGLADGFKLYGRSNRPVP
jgi:glycosyltransferase involved in cell wall biosynthesis